VSAEPAILAAALACPANQRRFTGSGDPTMTMRLATAALLIAAGTGLAGAQEALVAEGEAIYKKCKACHSVGAEAKNKIGPQQNDLFGRVAGTAEGYKYSKAMIAAGEAGLVWTQDSLAIWLKAPKKYVKGNKMPFSGLKNDADIAAVIAYLKTFDSDGMPDASVNTYEPAS
jgi:cytochrome c